MKRLLREALYLVRDAPLLAGGLWVRITDTRLKRAERERLAAALARSAREAPVEERAACPDGLGRILSRTRRMQQNGTGRENKGGRP